MTKETTMEHSAEWLRGAVAALTELTERGSWNGDADSMDSAVKCSMSDYRRQLLAAAEAREAVEREESGVGDLFNDISYSEGGGYDQGDVSEALYKAYALGANSLADQLAAAQAEARELRELARNLRSEHSLINADAIIGHEWFAEVFGKRMNSFDFASKVSIASTLLAARDARMKAMGAAEWLEAAAREGGYYERSSEGMREEAAQLRQQAEAARLAEGE